MTGCRAPRWDGPVKGRKGAQASCAMCVPPDPRVSELRYHRPEGTHSAESNGRLLLLAGSLGVQRDGRDLRHLSNTNPTQSLDWASPRADHRRDQRRVRRARSAQPFVAVTEGEEPGR